MFFGRDTRKSALPEYPIAEMSTGEPKSDHDPYLRFLQAILGAAVALAAAVFIGMSNTLDDKREATELTQFYHAFLVNLALVIITAGLAALCVQFRKSLAGGTKVYWLNFLVCSVPMAFGVWTALSVILGSSELVLE